jgi:hypothetical protein
VSDLDRIVRGLRAFVREVFPRVDYYALYEFEVVAQSGDKLDVKPVDLTLGFPPMPRVPMLPGLAGGTPQLAPRSRVLVGWVNGDPARPYVSNYAATSADGGVPTSVAIDADEILLGAGNGRVVCDGDTVSILGLGSGVISVTVGHGLPPEKSKVFA